MFTHFPKDPDCEICKITKIARAPCKNRLDARGDRINRSQNCGDATTADLTAFCNEENESRLQHRYAVVVPAFLILIGSQVT